jgi:DNA polymerase-4
MAAKIASDLKKPDGLVEVAREGLLDFLRPLDIRRIWGLGEKSEAILRGMGITTIGDLAERDVRELVSIFGKSGEDFWRLANGIDEREVETEQEAKSVSNEVTFERDTSDREKIVSALMMLCEKVSGRLRHERLRGRTITLKIRLEGFRTYTRAVTLDRATNFVDVIYGEAKGLYDNFSTRGKRVRLVGVKVSNLVPSDAQESLFKETAEAKADQIHKAVDRIRERFGDDSIYRAGGKIYGP